MVYMNLDPICHVASDEMSCLKTLSTTGDGPLTGLLNSQFTHSKTFTFGIHQVSCSTYFPIIGYHCFGKIQCFPLSHSNSQWTKFDLDEKWVKVNLVTIWTNLVVFSHLMLHTKFQANQPSGSGENDFFKVLPKIGIMAILVRRPGPFQQIFNLPLPGCCIWNLTEIGPAVSEEKFENGSKKHFMINLHER